MTIDEKRLDELENQHPYDWPGNEASEIIRLARLGLQYEHWISSGKKRLSETGKPLFGKTHGLSGSRVFKIWASMIARCNYPIASGYERYGGEVSNLYEEMQAYRDADGLYHSRPVGPDGLPPTANGIFTTSIMAILCRDDLTVKNECFNAIEKCRVKHPVAGYPMAGLYNRSVRQTDQEAHDDYIALTAAFWLLAQDVLRYGILTFFVYNNVVPDTIWHPVRPGDENRPWYLKIVDFFAPNGYRLNQGALLFRHIDFIAHLKLASAEYEQKLSLFQQLYWAGSMIATAHSDKSNQDGRILEWLKIQGYRVSPNNYRICIWAINYFFDRIKKDYGSMAKVWEAYVADGGKHPFCRYWR